MNDKTADTPTADFTQANRGQGSHVETKHDSVPMSKPLSPTADTEGSVRRRSRTVLARCAGVLAAAVMALMTIGGFTNAASAAVLTSSGSGLNVSYAQVDTCTYKVWWDYSGESKSVKVYGPTVTAPAGRTVYYRPLLFDTVTRQYVGQANWASWTMGSTGVRFGDLTFNTGFIPANSVHDLVVRLDIYAYAGSTQTGHLLLQTDYYRQYGGTSLGIPEGALNGTC